MRFIYLVVWIRIRVLYILGNFLELSCILNLKIWNNYIGYYLPCEPFSSSASKTHLSIINILYSLPSCFYNSVGNMLYDVDAYNTISGCMTRWWKRRRENRQTGETEGVFASFPLDQCSWLLIS